MQLQDDPPMKRGEEHVLFLFSLLTHSTLIQVMSDHPRENCSRFYLNKE